MNCSEHERIKLLDCTLRDGGFRLEDAKSNGESVRIFDVETNKKIIDCLATSGMDIIELGSVEIHYNRDMQDFSIYRSIEEVSERIPANRSEGQLFAALYRDPHIPTESIPNWNPSLCEVVRVIIRYSEMQKSLDFCKAIAKKGYKLFIQPAVTMRYRQDEIQLLIDTANEVGAYALYFVDTYGFMQENDICSVFYRYDGCLAPSIRIGFHAHNNMNLAFSNAQAFLKLETDRPLILDSCTLGMGQGAGNLQTELITNYMNHHYGKHYHYDSILNACELIEKFLRENTWGYSVANLLPAIYRVAYKYSAALRNHYGLSYVEINRIFKNMPDELRHRYTPENTVKLLNIFGYHMQKKDRASR